MLRIAVSPGRNICSILRRNWNAHNIEGGRLCSAAVEVAERIGQANTSLTPAERRVAEVVLERPQLVAFGTVADLAEAAGAGAATVVRLATKLGFDGFTTLQASIQDDLARQLRPAAERIREPAGNDAIHRHLQVELDNVRATLVSVAPSALADVVARLADRRSHIYVLSGDASVGVARQFVADLAALRDGVFMIEGNEVSVRRQISLLEPGDAVISLDLRRYDRWVVEAARSINAAGTHLTAITDSLLSPLAAEATHTFVVAAAAVGPFDSQVGTLALLNLMVTGVADRLRSDATERLGRVEAAWRATGALTDR
jgi:DNA-binding MurR/RpiR family transcriptional regulator